MSRPGAFTAQTARLAAAASVAVRLAKAQRRFEPADAPLAAPLPTVDDYTSLRLACVRAQLAQVDKAILHEGSKDHPDGQRLNWLAQAQDRLSEQERKLAGRPLPGSRRPSDHAPKPVRPGAWIVDASPAPEQPSSVTPLPATHSNMVEPPAAQVQPVTPVSPAIPDAFPPVD